MSRKHNTKHPERGMSTYHKLNKAAAADHYGEYKEGRRISADRLNVYRAGLDLKISVSESE